MSLPVDSVRLCIPNQFPRDRLIGIGREGVALCDGGGGRRGANNLPYAGFGALLTCFAGRSNRSLCHVFSLHQTRFSVGGSSRPIRLNAPALMANCYWKTKIWAYV